MGEVTNLSRKRLSLSQAVKLAEKYERQCGQWKRLCEDLVKQRMAMEASLKVYTLLGVIAGAIAGFAVAIFLQQ